MVGVQYRNKILLIRSIFYDVMTNFNTILRCSIKPFGI
jgi:hypothetical protein